MFVEPRGRAAEAAREGVVGHEHVVGLAGRGLRDGRAVGVVLPEIVVVPAPRGPLR